MNIGTNIKKRRIELKMSQDELALKLKYKTRSSIAKIESGENDLTVSKLEEIADALDTTPSNLLKGNIKSNSQPNYLNNDKKTVVILAGGKSTRNNQNIPNQFINVFGKPIIVYVMETYQNHPSIQNIYVVCQKIWSKVIETYCNQYGICKFKGIIEAGATGIESVKNSVNYLSKLSEINDVIFQEATRPMISEEMISHLIGAAENKNCAVMSNPMNDHLMFVKENNDKYISVSRNNAIEAQSPECYKMAYLLKAFENADKFGHQYNESCCTAFMNNMGYPIFFCDGNKNNIKIIRQEHIALFTYLLSKK